MRIPGRKTAVKAQRWLKSRLKPRAMIIGYHRVVNTASDVYDICVSPENFAQHLEILQRNYHPISLSQMVSGLSTGKLPHRSVAVTFDDGYADNLFNAKPLLERFEVPAAVFVSPGNLGQEFWWDELERMVTSPTTLPESIHLVIGGEDVRMERWRTQSAAERAVQPAAAVENGDQSRYNQYHQEYFGEFTGRTARASRSSARRDD
jgi:peptidoglycan/xylan/chitin deacetylase (PgdA/CDA1 family)